MHASFFFFFYLENTRNQELNMFSLNFAFHSTYTGLFSFFVIFVSLSQTGMKAFHVMQTVNKVCVGMHQGQTVLSQLAFVVVVR